MSTEQQTLRNLLSPANGGLSDSQLSDTKAAADMATQSDSGGKAAADMATSSDSDENHKIDTLHAALQSIDVEKVEAILRQNPEYLFKKVILKKFPDGCLSSTIINLASEILDAKLDFNSQSKSSVDCQKVEKIVEILSKAYYQLLEQSSVTEIQIDVFHRFNSLMTQIITEYRVQMQKHLAEHELMLTKIAKSTYLDPFCYDNPLNRRLFVTAFQKNTNIFELTVNYPEALEDLVQILKINKSLNHVKIGTRCVLPGNVFNEFIAALKQSHVNRLTFNGSVKEEYIIQLFQCKQLEKLIIGILEYSLEKQSEGIIWNSALSSALLENRTLKILGVILTSGLPEFLNCVVNQKSLRSLVCGKGKYKKQNDACELTAIRNLIIYNRDLSSLRLGFTIDFPDKKKAMEILCNALVKNETLKEFGFDPFIDYTKVDKLWSEGIVEAMKNVLNDNYTLTGIYIKPPPALHETHVVIKLTSPTTASDGFYLAESLGLDKNHLLLHEVYRQCERNNRIIKSMNFINEAVDCYNTKQFSEAHKKILQAIDEAKLLQETMLSTSLQNPNICPWIDAMFILGKVLARKFPQFHFYACHAFSLVKSDNPYYAQAKFELSAIIRTGMDLKSTLEQALEREQMALYEAYENAHQDHENSAAGHTNLEEDFDDSREAHLEQAITALPHLLQIQKVDPKKSAEKLEVGQEIKSLAEFYVNNGWADFGSVPNVELEGGIAEDPVTIINLLKVIKRQKDQYEALVKQLCAGPKTKESRTQAHGRKRDRAEMEERNGKDEKPSESSNSSSGSGNSQSSSDGQEPLVKKQKFSI